MAIAKDIKLLALSGLVLTEDMAEISFSFQANIHRKISLRNNKSINELFVLLETRISVQDLVY